MTLSFDLMISIHCPRLSQHYFVLEAGLYIGVWADAVDPRAENLNVIEDIGSSQSKVFKFVS